MYRNQFLGFLQVCAIKQTSGSKSISIITSICLEVLACFHVIFYWLIKKIWFIDQIVTVSVSDTGREYSACPSVPFF